MSNQIKLGKLSKYELRRIFANEEAKFTPWLFDNIKLLSEAVGIELVPREREKKIGAFELDIYAEDADTGDVVIIENQLAATDHSHLGQLITYAAGLDAKTLIWLVADGRDEHTIAVDWLNRIAEDEVRVFLVRVSAIQIDDSLPAVQFEVKAGPNDFERRLDEIRTKNPSIVPTLISWADQPNEPVNVSTWKEIFKLVLQRAIDDGNDLATIGVRWTQDPEEAIGYRSTLTILANEQPTTVDAHGSASELRRRISKVLSAANKPPKSLRIECKGGESYELP